MFSLRHFTSIFSKLLLFIGSLFLLTALETFAQVKTAVATGDWDDGNIWSPVGVPISTDSIIILSNVGNPITVNINTGDKTVAALVIDPEGANSILNINNPLTVTISRGVEITGTFNVVTASSGVTINVGGDWYNNGTFDPSGSSVTFNGTGNQSIGGTTFNNFSINKSSGTATLNGSLTINGNLSVTSGTLVLGSFQANRASPGGSLTVSNNAALKIGGSNTFPTNYVTVSLGATSTVEYNGSSQTIGRQSYGHLYLTGSGSKTLQSTDSIITQGNLTIDGVTFSGGSNRTHRIGGNWSVVNSGIYNSNFSNNTVLFNGTGTQTISGDEMRNLTVSKTSGTLSLLANLQIKSGNVTVSQGTFDLSTFTLNRTAAGGTFTVSNGATLNIGGTNTFPSNYSTITLGSSSTIAYNGGTQTITANSYGNLSLSGTGNKTAGGSFSIAGNFVVNSIAYQGGSTTTTFGGSTTLSGNGTFNFGNIIITSTLSDNGISFNVAGDWSKSGTYTATGASVFNGSGAQNIGASNFNNISFSGSGTKTISGALTVNGNWSNTSTISTSQTITFNGNGTQNIDNGSSSFASIIISNSGGIVNATNNVTLTGAFTLSSGTFTDGGNTISVAGDWTKSGGTYTATGTVELNGNVQSISASNFNNITMSGTGQKNAGGNIFVAGNLTLTGVNFVDASSTLTFNGNTTLSGTGTAILNHLSVTGTFNDGGKNYTVNGNWSNSGTVISSGTVTFSGTTSFSGSAATNFANVNITGSLILAASSNFGISGTFSSSGTFNTTSNIPNTVTFNGGAQSIPSLTYYALALSGGQKTASGNITLNNSLDVANGATFNDGSDSVIIDGTVNFSGNGAFNLNNVKINSAKSLSLGSTSLNIAGVLVNNGTISPGTSTVTLSGANKTISGTQTCDFHSLTVSGSVTTSNNLSFTGDLNVSGSFAASSGTANFNGANNTLSGTVSFANVSIGGGKNLTLQTNASLGISATFTISGTFAAVTNTPNTVLYNGTTQNIASTQYDDLGISGSGTKTAAGTITVNGNVSIANSSTFSDGGKSITFAGNISNSGTYSGNTGGTANFSSSTTLYGSGTYNFNTIVINGTLNSGNLSIGVAKDWTNNGTFISNGTIVINGNGSQSFNASNFYSLSLGGSGNKTFANGSTFTVTGDFSVSTGTFISSGTSFIFNGTSVQNISGGSFNNLEINNSSNITLSNNITVNGTLEFTIGDILTGSNSITLGTSALLNETNGNTIIGTVTTTRNILANTSQNTVGNIGVVVSTSNTAPGQTTITRVTGTPLGGGGSYLSNTSIERYFDITPTTNSNLNAEFVFLYDESELNGQTESSLRLWKSTNSGTSWSGLGGIVSTAQNSIAITGVNSFSRFTAADGANPLQPNTIVVRTYREADGKSSTSSDWVSRKWFIQLFREAEIGELVGQVESDSLLTVDTLSDGTYIASIADSSGWYHRAIRVNSGTIDSTTSSSKPISVSGGTYNTIDFANFHPSKLTVRKYLDDDGIFSTDTDRVAKKWNLTIYKTSVAPQNIHSQVTSDSVLVDSLLEDGDYVVSEADTNGYIHLGYVSSDSAVESSTNQIFISLSDGQVKYINVINKMNLNTIIVEKYLDMDVNMGTSGPDRVAKTWFLKVNKGSLTGQGVDSGNTSQLTVSSLDLNSTYYAIEADSIGWRHLGYIYKLNGNIVDSVVSQTSKSIQITFTGGGNTALIQFINSNADSGMFLTFTPKTNDTTGWGTAKKVPKLLTKALKKTPKTMAKPSVANILDTVFAKMYGKFAVRANIRPSILGLDEKKFPNGLYIGVPAAALNTSLKARVDTVAFLFKKDAKGFRLFVDHQTFSRGFDGNDKTIDRTAVKEGTKKATQIKGIATPKKPGDNGTNNQLAGELAALRMNIAMSEAGVAPSGLKELVFDMKNGTANVLNNRNLEQICDFVDTALTYWTAFYFDTNNYYNKTYNAKKIWRRYESGQPLYDTLYSTLSKINLAFNDGIDSNNFQINSDSIPWYSPLKLKSGVGKHLYLTSFLISSGKQSSPSVANTFVPSEPETYELYQNYPNPFNPSTTIEYYLPQDAFITLKIYNILGQEVQTLISNEYREQGYDEVEFDASQLSSGVYFYRMTTTPADNSGEGSSFGEFIQTKKLMLMK
ncbi:MAG: hypothetical protein FJ218_05175 [Ignavibacteria bacterium]|nr:hypothetical protein [Ignavibacteria bacterium]